MSKVSIIIPCYNKSKYIAEAINSALNQTYQDKEIIIINDGSTDNSAEIIQSFADKYENITFINETENHGVIYARNTAIEKATGEYILPLDGDDTIKADYLEKAIPILENNSKIGVVYCWYKFFGRKDDCIKLPEFSEDYLLYSSCISSASVFRKKDFIKVGKFNENLNGGCEDWDLWLSFYENGFEFYQLKEYMLNYRKPLNKDSRTSIQKNNQDEIFRQLIKNHTNLYLNNKSFMKKIFNNADKLEQKYKKYKNLSNLLIVIAIIEFVIILIGAIKL